MGVGVAAAGVVGMVAVAVVVVVVVTAEESIESEEIAGILSLPGLCFLVRAVDEETLGNFGSFVLFSDGAGVNEGVNRHSLLDKCRIHLFLCNSRLQWRMTSCDVENFS